MYPFFYCNLSQDIMASWTAADPLPEVGQHPTTSYETFEISNASYSTYHQRKRKIQIVLIDFVLFIQGRTAIYPSRQPHPHYQTPGSPAVCYPAAYLGAQTAKYA